MMGRPFFAEIGDGKEYGNDQCREELEIGGGKPGPDNDGQDEVIGHSAQGGGKKAQGEVFALAKESLADDDGGQAYDDGSAAHVDIGIALVLGQQRAGKTDEAIGDHQTENLHAVGGNALGPGHVLIIAGGPDGAAQLGAEEPVQQRHDGDDKDAADQNGGGHLGAGKQQLVLGAADGEIALAAHDVHIDGVEGQLGEDTGKDGRNAQYGMQKPGAKTGKRPGQHRAKQCQQGVHAADDAHGGNGAAGAKAVIYRVLDFGFEFSGGVKILTEVFGCDSGIPEFRLVFGESAREAMSDIGEKNSTNDHSMRDFTVRLPMFSDMEFAQTGYRFIRIELLSDNATVKIKSVLGVFTYRDIPYVGSYRSAEASAAATGNLTIFTVWRRIPVISICRE